MPARKSPRSLASPASFFNPDSLSVRPATVSDTDPQMLFALWDMEAGIDPETSLKAVEGGRIVYDRFRPRISDRLARRRS